MVVTETPIELVVAYAEGCTRGATTVQCWDSTSKRMGDRKVSGARTLAGVVGTPKRVVIGNGLVCVHDDAGIGCITTYLLEYSATAELKRVEALRLPILDVVGQDDGICALEAGGTVACFTESKPPRRTTFITNGLSIMATIDRRSFCVRHPTAGATAGDAASPVEHRCGRFFAYGSDSKLEATWRVRGLSAAPLQIDADDRYFAAVDEGHLKTIARNVLRPVPTANPTTGQMDLETATIDTTINAATALSRDSIWRRALSNGTIRNVDSHFEHGTPWPLTKNRTADALWTGHESRFFVRHGEELWEYGWQKGKRVSNRISSVKNPKSVGFNLYETCALSEDSKVACWDLPK